MIIAVHYISRLNDRINSLSSNDLNYNDKQLLLDNIKKLQKLNIDVKDSYGIRLIKFNINNQSNLYINIRGREYYRILDFLGKDSTGDEIWAIIRQGKLITIMLRKSIQPLSKLRVNNIIKL